MAPPKSKGQKMGLGEFLTDTSLGSWADEMEDTPVPSGGRSGYGADRSYNSGAGGNSSYTDRGYSVRESLPLPTKPPYTVHLGNMSFDATEGDIQDFFASCQVTNVRIVEDKLDRKPKGFGYAEFATLDGLKKALDYNGQQFQGRNIRVSVAEPQKDRPDAREFNDWTRKGPLPDLGQRRVSDRPGFGGERASYTSRSHDTASDAGERASRRPAFEQGDGKVRDFSNWERKGPLTPNLPPNTQGGRNLERPPSHDGPRDRKNSPAWGEGRSQDGSRPPRREFAERPAPERAPTAAEADNQWRLKMRPDPPTVPQATSPTSIGKDATAPSSPGPAPAASIPTPTLTTRPKLNLQKRTVSQAEPSPGLATGSSDAKASPFGAARPIDTSARDKEIEVKMQLKKEQDDKAREEKRVTDDKAKEERRLAKEADKADRLKERSNGPAREPHAETTSKPYQILRREAGDDASSTGEKDEDGADAAGSQNKAVKPQTIVQDVERPNGVQTGTSQETTAEKLEDEGWSTVSKASKNRKGAYPGARAIAS